MNKKLLAIALLLIVSSYVGYSYFQAYAIKKYINKNISNAAHKTSNISIAEISIGDFPISRRVKLSDIKFKHDKGLLAVASAKIKIKPLGNNLTVEDINLLTISDWNGNVEKFVELKPDMTLELTLDEKKDYSELKIINLGLKALDKNKKPLFDVQTKNSEVIAAIEKGSLHYSGNSAEYIFHDLINDNIISGNSFSAKIDFRENGDTGNVKVDIIFNGLKEIKKGEVINDDKNSNFTLLAEVNFSPRTIKLAPSQNNSTYSKQSEYLWSLDLKNLAIATSNYKITSSGNAATSEDDLLPTAQITLKIENFDGLITAIKKTSENFTAQANKTTSPNNTTKLAEIASASQITTGFIDQFSEIAKSTGAKNALSKDNSLIFEFRREKGQELLINNTSITELMMIYTKNMQNKMPQQQGFGAMPMPK